MSKRKTKQEKIIAELRHQISLKKQKNTQKIEEQKDLSEKNLTPKFNYNFIENRNYNNKTITFAHPYLIHDLSKTLILTGSIIIFELLLFFLSKGQV